MLRTFSIQTLGCRVNQYEGEQLAAFLRRRGLTESADAAHADLRVINTCSVTLQAAGKSRQLIRRATSAAAPASPTSNASSSSKPDRRVSLPQLPPRSVAGSATAMAILGVSGDDLPFNITSDFPCATPASHAERRSATAPRVVVTGCWATSDPAAAAALPGVDAVVGHHDDVAAELDRLLAAWQGGDNDDACANDSGKDDGVSTVPGAAVSDAAAGADVILGHDQPSEVTSGPTPSCGVLQHELAPKPSGDDGWIKPTGKAGTSAGDLTAANKAFDGVDVNAKFARISRRDSTARRSVGTTSLALLSGHQSGRQRAYLKVQDGCDAHCTYCIIPRLRGTLWSKPVDDAVEEAKRLVAAGHVELVLTGIFLGAYGQPTALRRRQPHETAGPLAGLVDGLCTRVPGLRRLRLSSLEPGDLTADLLATLRSHEQVVPHFHLPLQSGSDALLRRMNRQYNRGEFLRMVEQVRAAFDRPALTTDIIVGFPGETEAEFDQTLAVVHAAEFIHVHAFSYSPRPGTAAARWTRDFVRGPVVNERIEILRGRAAEHSFAFRRQFIGGTVEVLVEREKEADPTSQPPDLHHGRCERYFPVHFDDPAARPGDFVRVHVERVSPNRTLGTLSPVLRGEGRVRGRT